MATSSRYPICFSTRIFYNHQQLNKYETQNVDWITMYNWTSVCSYQRFFSRCIQLHELSKYGCKLMTALRIDNDVLNSSKGNEAISYVYDEGSHYAKPKTT